MHPGVLYAGMAVMAGIDSPTHELYSVQARMQITTDLHGRLLYRLRVTQIEHVDHNSRV